MLYGDFGRTSLMAGMDKSQVVIRRGMSKTCGSLSNQEQRVPQNCYA